MKRIMLILLGLGITIAAQAASTVGQTIGIDFGAIAPAAGLSFNHYSDVTIADGSTESFAGTLIDTDGQQHRFSGEELYDMQKDPLEQNDLSGNPEYEQTLKTMRIRTDKLHQDAISTRL